MANVDDIRTDRNLPAAHMAAMTTIEARAITERIKANAAETRRLLLEMYEREGWRALGYGSWREYGHIEFGYSESYVYRLMDAAKIEQNISPIGENVVIPESHLRPLSGLEPEEQREVYRRAEAIALNGKITAVQVAQVAQEYKNGPGLAVHYSTGRDAWETPQALFDLLNAEFHFTLDVCAQTHNAKCDRYFTPENDGLIQTWQGVCWMNPPYGQQIKHWIGKAYASARLGATVVCLIPARTDTAWWWDYCRHGEIRFIPGRLKFGDADSGAPFPSAVVVFGQDYPAGVVWWTAGNV